LYVQFIGLPLVELELGAHLLLLGCEWAKVWRILAHH
jgi:hypothetical protein